MFIWIEHHCCDYSRWWLHLTFYIATAVASELVAFRVVNMVILESMQKIWRGEDILSSRQVCVSFKFYQYKRLTHVFSQAEQCFVSCTQSVAPVQRANRSRRVFSGNSIGWVESRCRPTLVKESDDSYKRHCNSIYGAFMGWHMKYGCLYELVGGSVSS
jgi:hypothetical protein